ncbi:MAG TPA: hypothetical protein VFX19_01165, partial [Dehalococcoidia bacterium]|nr:hypothetical protein [Dehalococcoidia bacterium]
ARGAPGEHTDRRIAEPLLDFRCFQLRNVEFVEGNAFVIRRVGIFTSLVEVDPSYDRYPRVYEAMGQPSRTAE